MATITIEELKQLYHDFLNNRPNKPILVYDCGVKRSFTVLNRLCDEINKSKKTRETVVTCGVFPSTLGIVSHKPNGSIDYELFFDPSCKTDIPCFTAGLLPTNSLQESLDYMDWLTQNYPTESFFWLTTEGCVPAELEERFTVYKLSDYEWK